MCFDCCLRLVGDRLSEDFGIGSPSEDCYKGPQITCERIVQKLSRKNFQGKVESHCRLEP